MMRLKSHYISPFLRIFLDNAQKIVQVAPNTPAFHKQQYRLESSTTSSLQSEDHLKKKVNDVKDSVNVWKSNIVFQDGQNFEDKKGSDILPIESLSQILPQLAYDLNIEDLQIGLSLKSYYSGLVLLTKNSSAAEKLRKVISASAAQSNSFQTYLAITIGRPQCKMNQYQEMFLSREILHNMEMSFVSDQDVKSARKEGKMIKTKFRLKTISSNQETQSSLVEIEINKDKWDAIPVLLSHHLSPIVGDIVYSSRTNYLMGVPFPSTPLAAFPGHQRLPSSTENALKKLFHLESNPLPLFLHRHKVTLPSFAYRSAAAIEITAPPPSEFQTALDGLGLQLNVCG